MWTLAGGNLSEDDCEDGGDHFQDFDGNDDGNDDEDIVPPIAQSESTGSMLGDAATHPGHGEEDPR